MITRRHTLNTIVSRTFNKEFLSGVNISDLYKTTIISDLLNYHDKFQKLRRPLLKFFEWQYVFPYHYFTKGMQNLEIFPLKYEPYVEIIQDMYEFLEVFSYKFKIKKLSEMDIKLFDMFFQDMYISYINDIEELSKTIDHFLKLKPTIEFFKTLINSFKNNTTFNQFIEEQMQNKNIVIEYSSNAIPLNSKDITFLDFPMRVIHNEFKYRNAILKLNPTIIETIKDKI